MPRNAKKRPHKESEFQAYILWKSLPAFLRGQPIVILEKFGVTDPLAKEVLMIGSQTEFAQKYGIKDLGTLTDWNMRIQKEDLLIKVMRKWALEKLPNILDALYQRIMKYGKAGEVRLWLEYTTDWYPGKPEERDSDMRKLIRENADLKRQIMLMQIDQAKKARAAYTPAQAR